jgi:Muconolactone delta-isomerase
LWHHQRMPQYLVTVDIADADPLLPIDQLVTVVRDAVLPSIESLISLKAQGKVVTGGYPQGQSSLVLIMEADSDEQLNEILSDLPLSNAAELEATRLRSFEELRASEAATG